ncbi:hypothetical protein F3Y22_tig00113096pilonHSYRG00108 [Hibiscus syriacus]|uniref:Disease resistance N-terminal domain-containing protein n=1 Tax=Hibiscus syriacus TaxID=106335 RepID=A0A6A2Y3Z2_HIBSY|nr:hypothetical protein F3Y22_tig00113096pilonHSYRG00108 [Hibiscus syriacus]
MGESIAFDIITKLSSPLLKKTWLMWNFKDHLQDLISIVSAISVVLLDAEEQTVSSNLVKDYLEKLKDSLYDADDLLDDILTEALRKDQMSGNNLTRERVTKVEVACAIINEDKGAVHVVITMRIKVRCM